MYFDCEQVKLFKNKGFKLIVAIRDTIFQAEISLILFMQCASDAHQQMKYIVGRCTVLPEGVAGKVKIRL